MDRQDEKEFHDFHREVSAAILRGDDVGLVMERRLRRKLRRAWAITIAFALFLCLVGGLAIRFIWEWL